MRFKNLIFFILLTILVSCNQFENKKSKLEFKPEYRYKNSGFALIYNDDFKSKKLDQRSLQIFHSKLKLNHKSRLQIQ